MRLFLFYISIIIGLPVSMQGLPVSSDWSSVEEEVEMLEEIIEDYIALLFSDRDFRDKDPETKMSNQCVYGIISFEYKRLVFDLLQTFFFQNSTCCFGGFVNLANAP